MSKMKKPKKVDVRKVLPIGKELVIDRVNALELIDVYYIYLREKNIILTYNNKDLLTVVQEMEQNIYDNLPLWEEKAKRIIKKNRKETITGATIASLMMAGLLGGLTNFSIHEVVNVDNSETILEDYAQDVDHDGIKEIYTDSLENFNDYVEPTEFSLYKYINPFYQLSKNDRISDNISMKQAMENENIEIIKVDDELYSTTGYVSYFTVKKDDDYYLVSYTYNFQTEEEALAVTESFLNKLDINYSDLTYITTEQVKTLDEFPSIYKNKVDGTVSTKEGKKILTKVLNFD